MNQRVRAIVAVGVGLGLVVGIGWLATRPGGLGGFGRPAHPNVLVVVWDTTRADRMSLYGHDRPTTPRLERYADQAVVFERASSGGIWTLPSHASLFTGLPPESHGADERWMWLDGRHVTMAEHFQANGYATFTMAANTLLADETNLVQGFDVKLNTFKGKAAKASKVATHKKLLPGDVSNELAPGWKAPSHGAKNAEWGRAVFKEAAPIVNRTFLAWLDGRKNKEKPFFAFMNLMEAHTPRIPSMQARRQVMADDPELIELGLKTDAGHINLHFYNFGKYDYSERELEAIQGVYDASLAELDAAFAELIDGLSRRGVLDDTIVVLTSDHGENLGDHHLFNHRLSLWDSLVRVPLVIRYPDLEPRRVERAVSTVDVFGTVARLAGLPVPEGVSDRDLLAPDGGAAITHLALPLRREIETVANVHPDVSIEPWMRTGNAVVKDGFKLVTLSDGTRAVFDLTADPGELHPIDAEDRARVLEAELALWRQAHAFYDPAERGPGDDPVNVRAAQEELRAQLEAMGYTTHDEEPQPPVLPTP